MNPIDHEAIKAVVLAFLILIAILLWAAYNYWKYIQSLDGENDKRESLGYTRKPAPWNYQIKGKMSDES